MSAPTLTAREFLTTTFGDSALQIEGVENWGKETISGASFVLMNSRTFVSCGGQAIICLERRHTIDKRPLYLVLDDSDGSRWRARRHELQGRIDAAETAKQSVNDALTKEEWSQWHSSRPSDKLRLVHSA